jgi:serine/threonine-protein kinase
MNRASDPAFPGDHIEASQDAELGRILEAYLADREAGRPIDLDRLLAEHPAHAEQLRDCLAVMQMADRVADPSGSPSSSGLGDTTPRWDVAASPLGRSALTTLSLGDDASFSVHLRDVPDEREPVVKPRSDAIPALSNGGFARYQLQGEIARGGMGAILKGRDIDLGRDLAIKVLLDAHQGNPEVVRRFVEEAQIGGQLQHPGIVPVFELGTFPDRRPYSAMKLVKGRTLAALLHERTDPRHELPRFLAIFEQVAQTMAYAHARGVIHRDLKPSNVMAGSFGEVQVMDWGLAKVLPEGGIADESKTVGKKESAILTVRSGSADNGGESQAGSVLGTPSYMAPEQARGEVDRIDERADVFGLGAILCEILIGRPPFLGSTREEIRARAARGDLADALGRLDASGVDGDLVDLARDCLAAQPERRPRSASEVVRRLTTYLAGVQERLKTAELARVEAQARAEEAQARATIERSRQRRTVALAASVLGLALLGGGGWTYLARQRLERAAQVNQALSQVEFLYTEATRAGDDLARWFEARDAARAVERLLADVRDEPTRRRITALVRNVTEATTAAENDQKLLTTLVDIRSAKEDDQYVLNTDSKYTDAFREAGIDMTSISPEQVGTQIRSRPAAVKVALAAALDDWAAIRRSKGDDQAGARQLIEVARLVDPDPWRNRLREVLQTPKSQDRLTELKVLRESARIEELPAVSLNLFGGALHGAGDPTGAEAVLREGQRRYPGDVWLNYNLAACLERLNRREEAIRYYMAAKSLRPETAHSLAHALEQKGRRTRQSPYSRIWRGCARRLVGTSPAWPNP